MNPVHVDNLVDAIFLALDGDVSGEAFNVTDGSPVEAREYFGTLARMIGIARVPTAPTWLLRLLLRHGRFLSKTPLPSPAALGFLARRGGYDISKARRMLGYEPKVSLAEGMAEVAASLTSS